MLPTARDRHPRADFAFCSPYSATKGEVSASAGPWRAWRTAIRGQGLWPWTGAVRSQRTYGGATRFTRRPGNGGWLGADSVTTKRTPGGGWPTGFIGGVDADATAAQLPGDVGGAVFVVEQLPRGEHQGRAFADVGAQAGQRRRVGGGADRRVGEGQQRAAARGEQVEPGDRAAQQRQDDDERRQRRADLDRLGGGVGRAADPGRGVGERGGGEAGEEGRLAAAPAEDRPVERAGSRRRRRRGSSRGPARRRRRGRGGSRPRARCRAPRRARSGRRGCRGRGRWGRRSRSCGSRSSGRSRGRSGRGRGGTRKGPARQAAGPVAAAGGPAGGGCASVLGPPASAPPAERREAADGVLR